MKKTIIILILVALVGWGVYVFLNKTTSDTFCESGFRFVPSTQKCEPVGGSIDTEVITIDFSKVNIEIPGVDARAELKKDTDTGTTYSGTYKTIEGSQIQGGVRLDTNDLVEYSSDFILIPFVIDGGGTGQFLYLGLVDIKTNKHTSSVFIGDRVEIDSVQMSGEKIKANFKTRLDSEGFVSEPTIPAQVVLEIKDQKLLEILRLQNADYSDIEIKSVLPLVSKGTLSLKGAVPGTWYFEAIAGFRILDNSYNEIAIGSVQALSDWMTVQRVPFELTTSNITYKGKATLIIESDNTQGDEEGERKMKKMYIPVLFQ